ncbi:hypothetical protein DL991_40860 [Amycolatopsis sp. WAC 01375]|nr:hypothetical protein DL991_40860 [Amycolatopsis sp. WAC 01375]
MLLTADTDPDDVADALPTAELARKMLLDTRVRRVLLMLDTCYSGQGGNALAAAAITSMTSAWGEEHGSGLVVITSAQPSEQAKTGTFPRLLHAAVHSLPTAGYTPDTLPLDSVVKAMNTSADKPGFQTIGSSVTGLTGEIPPFLPNPRRDPRMTDVDLAIQHASEWEVQAERRDIELRTRLLVRAMGGHDAQGWWFAGRHTALLDITAWLHDPDPGRPLLAVTADPGSGKTAVLGLIATLAHPDRRATVPVSTLGLPAAAVPDPSTVDVAIYAQNLTSDQVLQGIAAAAHLHATTIGKLLDQLSGRDRPLTVLIDAVDEAADPDHLTRRLLRPLANHANGRLRLLVGTRAYLLGRLGTRRSDSIDLDADRYADVEALTTYTVRGLLEAKPHSPYRSQSHRLIRAVADAVAAAAQPSFLVARITSATLAAQETVADPRDPAWHRMLPRLPGDAMRRDLETRLGANAAKVRDLLLPLAFAEGQGLPWEDIWAAVASAASGKTYTDDDLLWLRQHAGSYVVEATESGRSTYRLYHQALAEHLRIGTDSTSMHRAITEVLQNKVPRALDGRRDWTCAHPYILRHLAIHAMRAGLLDTLITDADYLVYAEPDTLLLALHQTVTDGGALIGAIYRCSADIHRAIPPSRRRQVLATDAARFKATRLLNDLSTELVWPPRWATGRQINHALHATFTGHTRPVFGVACCVLDGRPVAVTVSDDRSARVWDLATAEEIVAFSGHTGPVDAVACAVLDGRPVAVTASRDRTVWVWDLATAEKVVTFTGHTGAVNAVACGALKGRPVAVTVSDDRSARVWDLATAEEIVAFSGHTGPVSAVACAVLDGRPVAVTASRDRTVWVWDLATAEKVVTFTGHTGTVLGVGCGVLDGRPVAVTASGDASVQVWDLATAEQISTFDRHTSWVIGVACGVLDGRPVAVSASDDTTAQVWDMATAEEIVTFTGHTGPVLGVGWGVLDGHPVAVTASGDATARVWRPVSTKRQPTHIGRRAEIEAAVRSVVDGRPVAVSASDDTTAQAWDLPTAEEIVAFSGHTGPVNAVACAVLDGRPVAVTASRDRSARVWNLATAEEIVAFSGHTGPVNAVACAVLDGRPVAVTASRDWNARAWDLATGERKATFAPSSGPLFGVACAVLDGRPVAVTAGRDRTVWVWDLATARKIISFTGHTRPVFGVACCVLDGRPVAVTVSDDRSARVWDMATAEEIVTFTGHTGPVNAVACSALKGRPVAVTVSDDRSARVWDMATAEEIVTFTGHTGPVSSVACGGLNRRPVAVSASDNTTVRVWDLATADEISMFDFRSIGSIAIGPGGELVVTAGWDIVVLDRKPAH